MKLKEFWDCKAELNEIIHPKFKYKLLIEIKNHSPYDRKFYIYGKAEGEQKEVMKFYLYTGLNARRTFIVKKYSKEIFKIWIPDVKINFVLIVEDEKGEKKEFTFSLF